MWALEKAPKARPVRICTDSMYVVDLLTEGYIKREDQGWFGVPNSDLARQTMYLIRSRQAPTYIQKVKGHSGLRGNEEADRLAEAGSKKPIPPYWDLTVPEDWDTKGARLSAMTFRDFTQRFAALRRGQERFTTQGNLDRILADVKAKTGDMKYASDVWTSLRRSPFRKETADFFWQAIHGRTACGSFVAKWGGVWEERALCECGALETLEHILCECDNRCRRKLWKVALRTLKRASATSRLVLTPPSYVEILGVGLRVIEDDPKAQNLVRLVFIETAFVIWKLRNARRIRDENITVARAVSTLLEALLRAAKVEKALTKLPENENDELRKKLGLFKDKWNGVIETSSTGQIRWIPDDHG